MNFQNILEKYRSIAFSERDKGDRFERLMQAYLRTAPIYEGQFKYVWMWGEFPCKSCFGGKDTGIDLVAETVGGDYWAVQCKCWDAKSTIDKAAVDGFIATSSKTFTDAQGEKKRFAVRLWVSTTNNWGSEAKNTIHNQSPPVQCIHLSDLENAPVDWEVLDNGISGSSGFFGDGLARSAERSSSDQ